jgi:hypothetical protein
MVAPASAGPRLASGGVLVLLVAVLLSGSASAGQMQNGSLGTGTHPSIAYALGPTDGGTSFKDWEYLHVVWAASTRGLAPNTGNAIVYCRIDLHLGTRCHHSAILLEEDAAASFSSPEISVIDRNIERRTETLVITDTRCCDTRRKGRYVLVSRDDGNTWRVLHPSLLERGDAGPWTGRRGLLEVVHPTDGTVSFVGGSTFSFGLPTTFQRVPLEYADVRPLAPSPGDFQRGLAKPVRAQVLGLLPDGRLFAVGYDDDGKAFWRAIRPGADPNDISGAWTGWTPLAIEGEITSIAYRPGRPTWLMYVGSNYEPRVVSFDGRRLGRPRLLGGSMSGDQTIAPTYGRQDLFMDERGGLHATWVTAGEGCLRTKLCLVYRYAEAGKRFQPTQILRVVAPTQAKIELPQITDDGWSGWVVSVERRGGAPDGTIHLSRAGYPHYGHISGKKVQRLATLEIPENPVTGRRFTARVAELVGKVEVRNAADRQIAAVKFTLHPPSCPPRTVSCIALRRQVVITRKAAPFTATFKVPEARTITTSDPQKNRLCNASAYVYVLKAKVALKDRKNEITLAANVSVCPEVK